MTSASQIRQQLIKSGVLTPTSVQFSTVSRRYDNSKAIEARRKSMHVSSNYKLADGADFPSVEHIMYALATGKFKNNTKTFHAFHRFVTDENNNIENRAKAVIRLFDGEKAYSYRTIIATDGTEEHLCDWESLSYEEIVELYISKGLNQTLIRSQLL